MRTQEAAGFIETFGFVPAIEAADVCVKTANVRLFARHYSGAGLVTIIIRGDVGAVKAAIEAGTIAADRVGQVITSHVIARPGSELDSLLCSYVQAPVEAVPVKATETVTERPARAKAKSSVNPAQTGKESAVPTEAELSGQKTVNLRNMARQLSGFPMSKQEIKFANKATLISAIIEYHQKVK